MTYLWLSAILFGLVHPGSKWILTSDLALLPFCILYIGIRLFAQIPILAFGEGFQIPKGLLIPIASFGVVGAILQLTEFSGIAAGLPVPLVTFLVYTHPVWTLVISSRLSREPLTSASIFKVSIASIGVLFLTGANLDQFHGRTWVLLPPILAGICMALWICLSGYIVQRGCRPLVLSFYYDLFSLVALLLLASAKGWGSIAQNIVSYFSMSWLHVGQILAYSTLVGLLPNFLFYRGVRSASALAAGIILLFEPIASTFISWLIWSDSLTPLFWFGAAMILGINLPWSRIVAKSKLILPFLFICIGSSETDVFAYNVQIRRTVHLVEIVPQDPTDYTVTEELNQIQAGAGIALSKFLKIYPHCNVELQSTLRRGTEEELFKIIQNISKSHPQPIVVGIGRSNFARIAAKAAEKSPLIAISLGASTTQLRDLNPHFFSIVSPWEKQWKTLSQEMNRLQCKEQGIVGVFDPKNVLSRHFADAFTQEHYGDKVEVSDDLMKEFPNRIQSKKCIFIAMNFSSSEKWIQKILTNRMKKEIFGIGDWNFFSDELRNLLQTSSTSFVRIAVPTGWIPSPDRRTQAFIHSMKQKTGKAPSPVGVYAHDAMLLGLAIACDKFDLIRATPQSVSQFSRRLPMLRHYDGISASGNLLSPMHLVRFGFVPGSLQ